MHRLITVYMFTMHTCIILCLLVIGSQTSKVQFLPDKSLYDKRPLRDELWVTQSTSVESCAIKCYKDITCKSFFYGGDGRINSCLGYHAATDTDITTLTHEHGWSFFRKVPYKPERGDCLAQWLQFESSRYCIVETGVTWYEAQSDCRRMGGYLVEIESQSEENFVEEQLRASGKVSDYWIGAGDQETEGTWVWSNSGNDLIYQNWHPGEPNNMNEEQDHGAIYSDTGAMFWDDRNSFLLFAYICEC